jgi:beta-glucosidase
MSRIGDRVWSAAPINEPWCVGWLSHFEGHHAPGMRDIRAASRAMHHVLKSHGASIEVMRGLGMTNLGAVVNIEWSAPASGQRGRPGGRRAPRRDLQPLLPRRAVPRGISRKGAGGDGAAPARGLAGRFRPDPRPARLDRGELLHAQAPRAVDGPWPAYGDAETVLPTTQMGWEIYPDGLRDFLLRVAREYSGDLPIHVTENGMANPDTHNRPDAERIAYLDSHLAAVQEAIAGGAPVAGLLRLVASGQLRMGARLRKRFGIVHVDFETLARTPKASYQALARWWRDATS